MLRRPNDHHRDFRAWLNTSISADDSHDQNRHVMTTLATARRRNTRSLRRSSTGHGSTRLNTQLPCQIVRQSSSVDTGSFIKANCSSAATASTHPLDRLASPPTPHPRHSNLHSACGTAPPISPAVSSLGGFPTPASHARHPSSAAGIRKPLQKATYAAQQRHPYCAPPANRPLLSD